jgi:nuclease-like protein
MDPRSDLYKTAGFHLYVGPSDAGRPSARPCEARSLGHIAPTRSSSCLAGGLGSTCGSLPSSSRERWPGGSVRLERRVRSADHRAVIELLANRDRPGRSASRHHTRVARAWRRRRFGRRAPYYAFLVIVLLLFLLSGLHLSSRWALFAGTACGMLVTAVRMLPDALMPGHIFNWQLGAWGEEMTATELAKLPRKDWIVRHDLRWGTRGANHDHVVAGPAVYVLNSKYLKDSRVQIEGSNLRVQRLDDPDDSYLADRWVPIAGAAANSLKRELRAAVGFGVEVYPVIVLWGEFDSEPRWIGDVFLLQGLSVADWIASRPADLLRPEKRQAVADYVRSLPRA